MTKSKLRLFFMKNSFGTKIFEDKEKPVGCAGQSTGASVPPQGSKYRPFAQKSCRELSAAAKVACFNI
jgi:hypothetical protein